MKHVVTLFLLHSIRWQSCTISAFYSLSCTSIHSELLLPTENNRLKRSSSYCTFFFIALGIQQSSMIRYTKRHISFTLRYHYLQHHSRKNKQNILWRTVHLFGLFILVKLDQNLKTKTLDS